MTHNTNNYYQNTKYIQNKIPTLNADKIQHTSKNNTAVVNDELVKKLEEYTKQVREQKQMMMNIDKEELVDVVLKQNSIIAQQSGQMIDLVNLVNNMDSHATSCEEKCMKNVNVLKKRNDVYKEIEELRDDSITAMSNSVRIQFVLFILFIIVLIWLLYNFLSFE